MKRFLSFMFCIRLVLIFFINSFWIVKTRFGLGAWLNKGVQRVIFWTSKRQNFHRLSNIFFRFFLGFFSFFRTFTVFLLFFNFQYQIQAFLATVFIRSQFVSGLWILHLLQVVAVFVEILLCQIKFFEKIISLLLKFFCGFS